jgi:hypothetical protein
MLDFSKYCDSFDRKVVEGIAQFLEVFGDCNGLQGKLKKRLEFHMEEDRNAAITGRKSIDEMLAKKGCSEKKPQPQIQEPEIPRMVVGFCPRCGKRVVGGPVKKCEYERTRRYFYKECTSCTYYSEIFHRRNIFTEVEGG